MTEKDPMKISTTSSQELSQKWDKKVAKYHSNYDYDEIVRHSNLSAGLDNILLTDRLEQIQRM